MACSLNPKPHLEAEAPNNGERPASRGAFDRSGRPDLNRGPHRPEIWAKFWVAVRNTWKSDGLVVAPPPLGFADLAVDSRGLGSEIELLPNRDVADGGGLVGTSRSEEHTSEL